MECMVLKLNFHIEHRLNVLKERKASEFQGLFLLLKTGHDLKCAS